MTTIILCDVTASVSELKNDPAASAGAGCGYPVAIIDSNRPVFLLCAPNCSLITNSGVFIYSNFEFILERSSDFNTIGVPPFF